MPLAPHPVDYPAALTLEHLTEELKVHNEVGWVPPAVLRLTYFVCTSTMLTYCRPDVCTLAFVIFKLYYFPASERNKRYLFSFLVAGLMVFLVLVRLTNTQLVNHVGV